MATYHQPSGVRYVEFVGVAGAGKTKAATLLCEQLQQRGRAARLRTPLGRRPFLKIRLFLSLPLLAWQLKAVVLTVLRAPITPKYHNVKGSRRMVIVLICRVLIDAVVVRYQLRHFSDVLINDEGLVQKVVELEALLTLGEPMRERLVRHILPMSSSVVAITIPAQVAMQRAGERGVALPFLDQMDSSTKESFYTDTWSQWQGARPMLVAMPYVSVMELANHDDIALLKKAVAEVATSIT